jgi:hypothetical protein
VAEVSQNLSYRSCNAEILSADTVLQAVARYCSVSILSMFRTSWLVEFGLAKAILLLYRGPLRHMCDDLGT